MNSIKRTHTSVMSNQMLMKDFIILKRNKKGLGSTITTKQDPIVQTKIKTINLPVVCTLTLTRASDGWGML